MISLKIIFTLLLVYSITNVYAFPTADSEPPPPTTANEGAGAASGDNTPQVPPVLVDPADNVPGSKLEGSLTDVETTPAAGGDHSNGVNDVAADDHKEQDSDKSGTSELDGTTVTPDNNTTETEAGVDGKKENPSPGGTGAPGGGAEAIEKSLGPEDEHKDESKVGSTTVTPADNNTGTQQDSIETPRENGKSTSEDIDVPAAVAEDPDQKTAEKDSPPPTPSKTGEEKSSDGIDTPTAAKENPEDDKKSSSEENGGTAVGDKAAANANGSEDTKTEGTATDEKIGTEGNEANAKSSEKRKQIRSAEEIKILRPKFTPKVKMAAKDIDLKVKETLEETPVEARIMGYLDELLSDASNSEEEIDRKLDECIAATTDEVVNAARIEVMKRQPMFFRHPPNGHIPIAGTGHDTFYGTRETFSDNGDHVERNIHVGPESGTSKQNNGPHETIQKSDDDHNGQGITQSDKDTPLVKDGKGDVPHVPMDIDHIDHQENEDNTSGPPGEGENNGTTGSNPEERAPKKQKTIHQSGDGPEAGKKLGESSNDVMAPPPDGSK